MKNRKANNRGFTLIEVILAMTILALISIPLMKYFSDSLRYTALMEQKQKATLLAQGTIEKMKSQEKLIRQVLEPSSAISYWIPSMAGNSQAETTDAEYKVIPIPETLEGGRTPQPFDASVGTGDIRLIKKDVNIDGLHYDIVADVTTNVSANTIDQAVVNGIDDRKVALIVERDEEQDVLMNFLILNNTYKLGNEGLSLVTPSPDPDATATPDPDLIPLYDTIEDIREKVKREINIEISREVDASNYFTVRAYYVYEATGITDKDKDIIQTNDIYNSRVEELESIYLLFNIFNPMDDIINVIADTSANLGVANSGPEIILMCQNMDALGATMSESLDPYSYQVTFPSATEYKPKLFLNAKFISWVGTNLSIKTNIKVKQEDDTTLGNVLWLKDDGSTSDFNSSQLTDIVSSTSLVRVVGIKVRVYKHGEFDQDTGSGIPLAEIKTTKSE